jgi:acyl-coenzyme A thioesterase PaaI-like protein
VSSITVVDATSATATAICPEQYEGGPNVAHGGWIAAALDDFLGRFLTATKLVVTASLEIRYIRPVPVGRRLQLSAQVLDHDGDRWTVGAQIRLEASGAELASARGVFVERGTEHFDRHERWLADQQQIG